VVNICKTTQFLRFTLTLSCCISFAYTQVLFHVSASCFLSLSTPVSLHPSFSLRLFSSLSVSLSVSCACALLRFPSLIWVTISMVPVYLSVRMFHRRILQERQGSFASSVFDHFQVLFSYMYKRVIWIECALPAPQGIPSFVHHNCTLLHLLQPWARMRCQNRQHYGDGSRDPTHSLVVSFVKSEGP